MAEQITQDVVKEAQSMGDASPIDATATTTINSAGDGEAPSDFTTANPKPTQALPTPPPSTSDAGADGSPSTYKGSEETAAVGGGKEIDIRSVKANGGQYAVPELPSKYVDSSLLKAEGLLVNGDAGDLSATEDATSQQALADNSGGSDTDISRPGSVDPSNERPGRHLRSNSIKKPTSFKSVSVTKNFLAKAVSTPVTRPGDKAPPAGQTTASMLQSAKPRLVAKSGSGLGSVMRSSLAKTNGAGSGPDATKVWNKNQPVPPPPPKQYTDEELKQQYGIHLATRLQADDTSKEAKWADIDDEEDDWAPETVEWMDGTKSTVTAAEQQPPPEEPKPSILRKETPDPVRPVPTPTTIQRPSSTSGTKTILKPGAHTSSTKSNLVLKGAPEKPTLVAKPSAPAQVKSPWAPLPPVEKVSPIQINPPTQPPPPSRFSQRDPHGFDALPPVPPATKEFAPDDFNRSWRDERGNKELFNSHNGRYEPVNEMRRGSLRENNFRQPSVLQRPSPQGAPAEPSAAFQTSRSSGEGPTWGRRRNSSNVSGGSGRRPSFAPDMQPIPLEMQHRRGSLSFTGSDIATPGGTPHPTFAQRHHVPEPGASPAEQHHSWTQRSSPNISHVQPASPFGSIGSSGAGEAAQIPVLPIEDAVATQKRLMQEKIERARLQKQRQQEEEAKEEAAKKERLRLKLEAMGISESKEKEKPKEASPSRPAEKSPLKEKAVPAPVQSPPKPPVPQSEGEVAQYGMMKVHQPHPVRKANHLVEVTIPELKAAPKPSYAPPEVAPKRSPSPLKALSAEVGPKAVSLELSPDPPTNAKTGDNRTHRPHQLEKLEASDARAGYKPADRPPQTLSSSSISTSQALSSSQDSRTAWSSGLTKTPSSSSNVWGPPPHRDRALGNGTFETSSFNRASLRTASQQQPHQASSSPGPIAPPSSVRLSPAQQSAVPVHPQAFSSSSRSNESQLNMGRTTTTTMTGRHQPRQARPMVPPNAAAGGAWGGFADSIARDDAVARAKNQEAAEKFGAASYQQELTESFTPSLNRRAKVEKTHYAPAGGHLAVQKPATETPTETKPVQVEAAPSVELPATKAGNPIVAPIETTAQPATAASGYGLHPMARAAAKAESATVAPVETTAQPATAASNYGLHPVARAAAKAANAANATVATVETTIQPATAASGYSLHPMARAAAKAENSAVAAADTTTQPATAASGYGLHPMARAASRFFPRGDASSTTSSQASGSGSSQMSDSPPPPESQSHPAFDGDAARPKVNLPVPKAVVKLPPQSPPVEAVIMPARAKPTAALGAQPITNTLAWQARFNGLFGKKDATTIVSPPVVSNGKPALLAVTSASKAPLDDVATVNTATVSLPITPTKRSFVNDDSEDVLSRVSAEESLFDDREFGSLPVIKLPTIAHAGASLAPVQAPSSRPNSKFQRLDVTTKSELEIGKDDETAKGTEVIVHMGNMTEAVTKNMARRRNDRRTSGYQKRAFTPRNNSNTTQSPRARNQSGNYQGQGGSTQNSTPRPTNAGSRPTSNGNWNARNNSTQPSNAWNKRTTPGVVH